MKRTRTCTVPGITVTFDPGPGGRAALCRCGGTGNPPFCDGTHRVNGFRPRKPAAGGGPA